MIQIYDIWSKFYGNYILTTSSGISEMQARWVQLLLYRAIMHTLVQFLGTDNEVCATITKYLMDGINMTLNN